MKDKAIDLKEVGLSGRMQQRLAGNFVCSNCQNHAGFTTEHTEELCDGENIIYMSSGNEDLCADCHRRDCCHDGYRLLQCRGVTMIWYFYPTTMISRINLSFEAVL